MILTFIVGGKFLYYREARHRENKVEFNKIWKDWNKLIIIEL